MAPPRDEHGPLCVSPDPWAGLDRKVCVREFPSGRVLEVWDRDTLLYRRQDDDRVPERAH